MLSKSSNPNGSEKVRKKNIQPKPRRTQNVIVRKTAFLICFLFPFDWASEMEGRSRVAAEPVMAQGNMTSGKAIPEKTPYMESASVELSPLAINCRGSWKVSTVEKRLIQTRFILKGHARRNSS